MNCGIHNVCSRIVGGCKGRWGGVSVEAVYLCFRVRRVVRLGHCHFFSVNTSRCCCSSCTGRANVGRITRHSCVPTLGALVRVIGGSKKTFGMTLSVSKMTLRRLRVRTPTMVSLLRVLGSANYYRFLTRPCSRNLSSLTGRSYFHRRMVHRDRGVGRVFNGTPGIFHGSDLVCSSRVNTAITDVNFGNVLARNTGRILN